MIDRYGLIGEIRLPSVDRTDRRARLAVGLFAPDHLGRAAIRLVLAHAFAHRDAGGLGLNRLDLRVLAFNERAIRCYRACGFVEEGRERQAACIDGTFCDDVIMGILAADFSQAAWADRRIRSDWADTRPALPGHRRNHGSAGGRSWFRV